MARADTRERHDCRRRFLDELLTGVPVQPVTLELRYGIGQRFALAVP